MKLRDLLKHLHVHGGEFLREGGNHSVYVNRRAQKAPPFHGIVRSMTSL